MFNSMPPTMPLEEAKKQVRDMATMMASLYYHFSHHIIDALGPMEGKKLIAQVIDDYGAERGLNHRVRFELNGLEVTPENYVNLPDLPKLGWDTERPSKCENATHTVIKTCPLAQYWKEQGFEDIGLLYCRVDQAKYSSFHPDSELIQIKNVLKGDPYCEMVCRNKNNE